MKHIADVAYSIGIDPEIIEPYGRYKAKLPLEAFLHRPPRGQARTGLGDNADARRRRKNHYDDRTRAGPRANRLVERGGIA